MSLASFLTSFVVAKVRKRGASYLSAGQVTLAEWSAERVVATVSGSEDYSVEIRREGQFVLVTGCRIEDLGNELAHRAPSLSQEVVDFGEHQSWHEDEARRRQS